MNRQRLTDPDTVRTFLFGGRAVFTVVSTATGARYTYKIQKAASKAGQPAVWFVQVLRGADNTRDYAYIGYIKASTPHVLTVGRAGSFSPADQRVLALGWILRQLRYTPKALAKVEVWHAGKCGACGRKLTVPHSIRTGFGPHCAARLQGLEELAAAS